MANENKDVLLRIKVDAEKAVQAVKEYTQRVNDLKERQLETAEAIKKLEEQQRSVAESIKKGNITAVEGAKVIGELSIAHDNLVGEQIKLQAETKVAVDVLRGYNKELQNCYKQEEMQEGSLAGLRAELSNTTKAFDSLSRVEREGAKGRELLDHINALTDEIKEAEEATQRYQRNVGNYKSALKGAEKAVGGLTDGVLGFISGGNPLIAMLANTASQLGSVKKAFSVAGQGAVMLGKQLWALIATPIGAFLTAVAVVVTLFNKGLKSSEERTNRFKVVLAPLQGALDGLANILGTVCDWLLSFVEWQAKAWESVLKFTAALTGQDSAFAEGIKTRQEYIAIEKESQELERKIREEKVLTAEREREISELRAKFAEKDKYTNKERLAFLDEAIKKEKEQAQANKEIAEKKLELLEREASMSDNDAEMNNKLAEAKAEVIKADKALSDKLRELNAQRVEAINSINAEKEAERKAQEEKAKMKLQALKKQKEEEEKILREAEDAMNEIIKDNVEKQRAILLTEYTRKVEDLKKRLAEEQDLTVEARIAIQQHITALDEKYAMDSEAIDKEVAERKAQADKEQRKKIQQEEIEERALQLEIQLAQLHDNELAQMEAKLMAKKEELDAMHQLEDESDAEFQLRQLNSQNEYADLEKEISDKKVKIAETESLKKREAYNSVMNAMSAMSEHSKALGKVAKVMGLAQIAVDTGKAISSGVAEAVKAGPFPANLAAIATTIATVMANMATAITSIKSAKFATGGLVEGAGSGTSDSIPAMLSNGESVMTAQATSAFAPILSTLNQMGGGVPINISGIGTQQMGEDMLARAVARGVAELRPVVSVEEFNRVSNNVRVIENLATL